jgi:hypothetical protein
MKSGLKKIALALIGLVPFIALKSPLAAESDAKKNKVSTEAETTVPAAAADPQELAEYQDLIRTNFGVTSDIIGLNYHDESQTVDLSTFDGNNLTVPMRDMHPVPNGE